MILNMPINYDFGLRRKTRQVKVGEVLIGGNNPISIQSMTTADTCDSSATLAQIKALSDAGCEIVRLAVPNETAAANLAFLVKNASVPLVADIHFDYKLALTAIDSGISKLRINPGNIGGSDKVKQVVTAAKEHGIPIRIGVNAGSLEKSLLDKYHGPTAAAMVESALGHVKLLEDEGFYDIVISLKASAVPLTVAAYRELAAKCDYPLHIGITEAGTWYNGSIRSAVGLGVLLAAGIGDTMRVSLTGDPVREVAAAQKILEALELREFGAKLVSCPTCGRCQVNLEPLAMQVEQLIAGIKKPLKIAVMGCAVNGPGEAREADLGVAGGRGEMLLFRKGEIIRKVPEDKIIEALKDELQKILEE